MKQVKVKKKLNLKLYYSIIIVIITMTILVQLSSPSLAKLVRVLLNDLFISHES